MQIVFYFGLNAAVAALLGGKLLLQSRLAVIQAVSAITGLGSDKISVCAWGED